MPFLIIAIIVGNIWMIIKRGKEKLQGKGYLEYAERYHDLNKRADSDQGYKQTAENDVTCRD